MDTDNRLSIRPFQPTDAHALWQLNYETIRHVCIKDYSLAQIEAWAPDVYQADVWLKRIAAINPFVAFIGSDIVGYADIQADGYIDHFFCNKQHVGKGVGGSLMRCILRSAESNNIERIYAHVSITAKPFFEHFGFKVLTSQIVTVRGVNLKNYVMERLG